MKSNTIVKTLAVSSLITLGVTACTGNPFQADSMDKGYEMKKAEHKCGEAKCGADKKADGNCGGDKKADHSCGADKKADGKCGEGKCGADKKK
ncbi:hypothetical protein VH441_06430 [Psychrobacter sp. HD31]|uniref:HvfA family oxazolone/thioamide-modified RiPP metallophore n=1 Tax=Psychrobacter sp. HD31 TaxID=3112003 RepID=UPI003DA476B3